VLTVIKINKNTDQQNLTFLLSHKLQ